MMEELISIVIPIYNAEKYLDNCIKSIINQTYINLEIILVDDGSSDDSLSICKKYAKFDKRIIILHQENKGVSSARNLGLYNAKGKYISFVDSDDELFCTAIEKLINIAIEYNADVVSGKRVYINKNNNLIEEREQRNIETFSSVNSLEQCLKLDRRFTGCHGKLFSRKIIGNTCFFEGKKINEDMYFLFEICTKKPRLICINELVYKYYIRPNTASTTTFSEKYFDMLYFSDLKMQYINENIPELLELAKDMEVSTHLFLLEVLCRTSDLKYKKDVKNSIKKVRKRYLKYRSINRHERIMAAIVFFGLYPLYKKIIRTKYRNKY